MSRLIDRLTYSQFWNIGFCEQSYDELLDTQRLKPVRWMRHSYRDRWFADPFIFKVTDEEIVVFVEECPIANTKGIICELVIDRKSFSLKKRYVLLELETHLSYPAIIRENGKIYVYPENGKSGKLNIYEYDEHKHKLINGICILDEAVADSTIAKVKDKYYLICTKYPETLSGAYLYRSDNLFGPYMECGNSPVAVGRNVSRPGGDWFPGGGYRPAQICSPRYGSGLAIRKISFGSYKEDTFFSISPTSWRYNLGIHTINNHNGLMVIDGYGYKYPIIGRSIEWLRNIKHRIFNR